MKEPPDRPIVQLPDGLTVDQMERMIARGRSRLAEERAVIRALEDRLRDPEASER